MEFKVRIDKERLVLLEKTIAKNKVMYEVFKQYITDYKHASNFIRKISALYNIVVLLSESLNQIWADIRPVLDQFGEEDVVVQYLDSIVEFPWYLEFFDGYVIRWIYRNVKSKMVDAGIIKGN